MTNCSGWDERTRLIPTSRSAWPCWRCDWRLESNGVSKLHATVSRRMWRSVWPAVPEKDIPISAITNGVHLLSWISNDMTTLLSRYLGPVWAETPNDPKRWQNINDIPDEELWRTHERRRERLVAVTRARLLSQLRRRGAPPSEIAVAQEVLNPAALTIGFARRFATYKRANLLFRDINRLAEILSDDERPVQFIFAGKAHPRDDAGKQLIRQIIHHARREPFRHHVVFLENYDIELARYMVQGCDLWLNTPRRPREASGTSGMKAAINGVLNCSCLDGWWDEAYRPEIGWAIGNGETYDDPEYQDSVESSAVYDLLEDDIIPMFYDRNHTALPRRWIAKVKASMSTVCPTFNTVRMVHEYAERFYIPCRQNYEKLVADNGAQARELSAWKQKVRENWPKVQFVTSENHLPAEEHIGVRSTVTAHVKLGALSPDDVWVEIYHGAVDDEGEIVNGDYTPMAFLKTLPDGTHEFEGMLSFGASGLRGYTLRITPHHPAMNTVYEPGLIRWASDVLN